MLHFYEFFENTLYAKKFEFLKLLYPRWSSITTIVRNLG